MQVAALRNRFQQPGFAVSQNWSDFARHTVVQIRDIVDAMQVGLRQTQTHFLLLLFPGCIQTVYLKCHLSPSILERVKNDLYSCQWRKH